jgi:hypothetical protein
MRETGDILYMYVKYYPYCRSSWALPGLGWAEKGIVPWGIGGRKGDRDISLQENVLMKTSWLPLAPDTASWIN